MVIAINCGYLKDLGPVEATLDPEVTKKIKLKKYHFTLARTHQG